MPELALFPIETADTVTSFALGPMQTWPFAGAADVLADKVDYKFINGFVDVGDLPCRVATWDEMKTRGVPALEEFDTEALYLPGFNRRLDFSGFWHVPHRLKRWCRTTLITPTSGDHPFEIATCGGINIWVDGQHIIGFEPFTRNSAQTTTVDLPLKAEGSEVVILLEDMAERDTSFFAELTWLGAGTLNAALPTSADPKALSTLMGLARSVHPSQPVFDGSAPLELMFEAPVSQAVHIDARVGQSVHLSHKPPLFTAQATVQAGARSVTLGSMSDLADAYHPLSLTFSIGEMKIERGIGFALMRSKTPPALPDSYEARKSLALSHAAKHGELRTGRLLAQLEAGVPLDDASAEILADTLEGINARRDCSDFVMVPLLWIYARHHQNLPDEMAKDIKAAILNYRYWMDEPGNDAMWFWSENHVLCFHVSEYIAGALFADEVFPNAGLTGAQHRALAEKRLSRWMASTLDHGLAEWNSAAYYPIDFIGLLGLFEFADGALKRDCKTVLDSLFAMIALHNIGGVSAGTMGRAYDKELRAGPLSELAPFAAVAFGQGWLSDGVAALPMLCAGQYEPPEDLARYAQPHAGEIIQARYVQGYGTAAQLALFKTADVQLSASIDLPAGSTGHQQHLVDVQMAGDPFARVWVNHPGEDDPWGSGRPSFWAGNGTMPRIGVLGGTCLILSDLGDDPRLAFTHAYAPIDQFDEVAQGADWIALRSGQGTVLLKATGPILSVTRGPGAGIEHRCMGAQTGWAIIASAVPQDDLNALKTRAEALQLTLDGTRLHLTEPDAAPLSLDYTAGLFQDGTHIPFSTQETVPQITVTPAQARRVAQEV